MTRVLRTYDRSIRQAVRHHRATFINERPKIYSRMTAAREWEALHATHGNHVATITNFEAIWKRASGGVFDRDAGDA